MSDTAPRDTALRGTAPRGAESRGAGLPADAPVVRRPFWLPGRTDEDEGALAIWLHVPASRMVGSVVAVLCPPIGFELTHSYRSLRRLADELALRGIPTLRFDYFGSGSSAGDALAPALVPRWLDDIARVAGLGRELTGATETALVGLRLGATLAAHAAASSQARHLVLWAPVASGRAYVREWEALQRMGSGSASADFLDAGGFVLSREAADRLKALKLAAAAVPAGTRVLHLRRDDLPSSVDPFPASWPEGVEVETAPAIGYADLMATPQDTKIPFDSVERITSWLERGTEPLTRTLPDAAWETDAARVERVDPGPPAYAETFVTIPGAMPLFGVWTVPHGRAAATTVVLSNSGSVHHVGPHRLYVELARALAAAGIASVRFDLRNLGDSLPAPADDENHPYPATATDDVAAVVAWAAERPGCERVVVAGLCSGAHASFHAGLDVDHPALAAALLINPLTFRWRDGMSLAQPTTSQQANEEIYYRRRLTDPAAWKRLLTLQTDYRGVLRFAHRLVGVRIGEGAAETLARLGLRHRTPLAEALLRYDASGRPLAIVFSASDPGRSLLLAEARLVSQRLRRKGSVEIVVIQDADHTFSARDKRREVVELLVRMLGDGSLAVSAASDAAPRGSPSARPS